MTDGTQTHIQNHRPDALTNFSAIPIFVHSPMRVQNKDNHIAKMGTNFWISPLFFFSWNTLYCAAVGQLWRLLTGYQVFTNTRRSSISGKTGRIKRCNFSLVGVQARPVRAPDYIHNELPTSMEKGRGFRSCGAMQKLLTSVKGRMGFGRGWLPTAQNWE